MPNIPNITRTVALSAMAALAIAMPARAGDFELDFYYDAPAGPYYEAEAFGDAGAVQYFFDDLAPYGDWIHSPDYGWVWRPRAVPSGWRPYTDGRWVWTDDGWTWLSDWDWGWAPFHYGRWYYDDGYDWVWVPGLTWAPAWVAWRHDHDICREHRRPERG